MFFKSYPYAIIIQATVLKNMNKMKRLPDDYPDQSLESQREMEDISSYPQRSSLGFFRRKNMKSLQKPPSLTLTKKVIIISIVLIAIFFLLSTLIFNEQTRQKVKQDLNNNESNKEQSNVKEDSKQSEKIVTEPSKKQQDQKLNKELKQQKDAANKNSDLWFEKNFWLFHADTHNSIIDKLYYQNNKYFAKKSGFKLQTVSFKSAYQYLSAQGYDRLTKVESFLKGHLQNTQANEIILKVAMLSVLAQKGGVMLSQYYCLTETFDWLRDINSEVHARRGLGRAQATAFGFYSPSRSSPVQKENIAVEFEVDKYIRAFPGLQSYFLVAKKKSKFITELLDQIIFLLLNPSEIGSRSRDVNFYGSNSNNVYSDYFHLAVHMVLQRKQKELDQVKGGQYRELAVDYYGLFYINQFASALKTLALYGDLQTHVQILNLARQNMEVLYDLQGPFIQLTRLTPFAHMNNYLEEIINGKREPIVRGSFIHRMFFPESNESYIIDDPEKPFVNSTNEPWDNLPKKIWLYWHNGIQNAPLSNQMCVQVMKRRAKESGIEVNLVSEQNLNQFLDQNIIDKIHRTIREAKLTTFPQSKPDMIRLALLIAHGGIYFDVSYAPLTNFDWLLNIGKFPSKYIFNRFGHLPKVIVQFHPNWGGVFQWKVNSTINTKVQWQLSYENNFIAAQKDNQLIKNWFDLLISFYSKPYHEVSSIMQADGLVDNWNSEYLMPMDTLKCVLSRKEKEIKANPSLPYSSSCDYYKLWSISGNQGIQKYRDSTGFQSHQNPDNTFVYRYSEEYVTGFIGKNFNLVKFYGYQNARLSEFIRNNKNDHFKNEAHPQSLFMKYVYSEN